MIQIVVELKSIAGLYMGTIWGSIIGLIKEDARNLENIVRYTPLYDP